MFLKSVIPQGIGASEELHASVAEMRPTDIVLVQFLRVWTCSVYALSERAAPYA